MKVKAIRHGEILLVIVDTLTEGIEKADTDVIMNGSGGNDHKIVNGEIYFKNEDQFIFGYLIAKKDAKLLHAEHGSYVKGKQLKECDLPEGVYQLRRQVEFINGELRPIID